MSRSPQDRIVITGMGLVSPLANGVEASWKRLVAGHSGIRRLADDVVPDVEAKVAASVPTITDHPAGLDFDAVVHVKDRKKIDRFILFAIEAARQAIEQANWTADSPDKQDRTATIIASGIGGFLAITDAVNTVNTRGSSKLSPFTIPSFLVNLAAGHVSIRHGFKGPIGAPVTACAASVQAIGDGVRLIRSGEADIALCGGSEACINRVALGGFAAARGLSTHFNDQPERASRPFDTQRDGFVMGEGAGMVVIETLAHAQARGAKPLAEIVGYGTSADAYHLTAGAPDGSGARSAMTRALRMANLAPDEIGYLNAHATSTPVGDSGELAAIKAVFGGQSRVSISSTKSATGHLLGAAGAMEAIFSALALRDGLLPPTLNLDELDPIGAGLDVISKVAREKPVEYALSNGFGFGGVNASVILRRWSEAA